MQKIYQLRRSAWSRIKRALRIVPYFVLITALVLLVAVLVVPHFTGLQFDPVVSGSMEPTIKTGATIAIAKVDPGQIHVGDIIGFSVPGIDKRICHRVIAIVPTSTGYGFRTKGDANGAPDAWVVNPRDVTGKVYFNTSFLLPAAKFVRTPAGFLLLFVLPALIVGGWGAREIWRWGQKRKSKESPGLPAKVD